MKRRAALALSLFLSTIVGFFIVAYGTQVGFFGSRQAQDDAAPAGGADQAGQPTPTLMQPPARVIEQYVYEDVVVPGSDSGGSTEGATAGGGGSSEAAASTAPDEGSDGGTGEEAAEEGETRVEGLNGFVAAVGEGNFTLTGTHVGDAIISVSSETEYSSAVDRTLSFSEVQVGTFMRTKVVVGEGDTPTGPGGSWEAVSVREDLLTQSLNGTVASVGYGGFTLTGTKLSQVLISVTPSTKYESEIDGSLTWADIQPGMYLKTKVVVGANGPTGADGSWVAVSVKEALP